MLRHPQKRMMKSLLIGALLLALSPHDLHGQRYDLKFQIIDNKSGLPQNSVQAIAQDSLGFVWIGTQDGLCRYDGEEIRVLNSRMPEYSELLSNDVTCLVSSWPILWIGTIRGLNSYNIALDKIEQFQFVDDSENTGVQSIAYDDVRRTVWVGTSSGLFSSDVTLHALFKLNSPILNHINARSLRCYHGILFVASDVGLLSMSLEDSVVRTIQKGQFKKIALDQSGNICFLSTANEVYSYDSKTQQVRTHGSPLKDLRTVEINDFCFLMGRPLFCTKDNGIYYNGNWNQTFGGGTKSLSEDRILCNFVDRTGVLWVGTLTKGLCKYNPNLDFIEHYTSSPLFPSSPFFLPRPIVWSFSELNADTIVIGMDEGGISYFDKHRRQFGRVKSSFSELRNATVRALSSIDDNIWIGDDNGNLYVMNKHGEHRIHRYAIFPMEKIKIIKQLAGSLIAVGTDHHLHLLDISSKKRVSIDVELVYSLYYDSSRHYLLVGSRNKGLIGVNVEKQHYDVLSRRATDILALCHTKSFKDKILVGTKGMGLLIFDSELGQYVDKPLIKDPRASVIHGVVEDRSGEDIWVSTNSGIYQFNISSGEYTCYAGYAGMQDMEFCGGAYFADRDGRIYFGGINGFNVLDPEKLERHAVTFRPNQVYIADLQGGSIPSRVHPDIVSDSNVVVKSFFRVTLEEKPILFRIGVIDFDRIQKSDYQVFTISKGGDSTRLVALNNSNTFSFDYSLFDDFALFLRSVEYRLTFNRVNDLGGLAHESNKTVTVEIERGPIVYLLSLLGIAAVVVSSLIIGIRVLWRRKRKRFDALHRERINDISGVFTTNRLIDLSLRNLKSFYGYERASFARYDLRTQKFLPVGSVEADDKLYSDFITRFETSGFRCKVDADRAITFQVFEHNLATSRNYAVFEDTLIVACVGSGQQSLSGDIASKQLLGVFLCKKRFLHFREVEDSLIYVDNVARTLYSILERESSLEIETIVRSTSERTGDPIRFLEEIISHVETTFPIVKTVELLIHTFNSNDNSRDLLVTSNRLSKTTSPDDVRELQYQGSDVMTMKLYSVERLCLANVQFLESLFIAALEFYYRAKLDSTLREMVLPFKLFSIKQLGEDKESSEEAFVSPLFTAIQHYFGSDYVSFWIKDVNDREREFYYHEKFCSIKLKDSCPSFGTASLATETLQWETATILDLENDAGSCVHFLESVRGNEFRSCIYVPIGVASDGRIPQDKVSGQDQFAFIVIYSKRQILKLFKHDYKFLGLIADKGPFIQARKLIDLTSVIHHESTPNLRESLQKLIDVARRYSFSDLIMFFWYKNVDTMENKHEKEFIYSGVLVESSAEKVKASLQLRNDLIDDFIPNRDEIIWIEDDRDYQRQFGKRLSRIRLRSPEYSERFYYREGIKSFVACPLISGQRKIGIIFFNFRRRHFRRNDENEYMIRSFVRSAKNEFISARYYEMLKIEKEVEKAKLDYERRVVDTLRLEFIDSEKKKEEIKETLRATLSNFSDYTQFLMFRSLFHDMRSFLSAQLESLSNIDASAERLTDVEKVLVEKEIQRVKLHGQRITDFLQLFDFSQQGEEEPEEEVELVPILKKLKSFFLKPEVALDPADPEQRIDFAIIATTSPIPPFKCKRTLISMVFYNLISNAIYALSEVPHRTDKQIQILLRFNHNNYTITVRDNGLGLKRDEIDEVSMFKYGKTTKPRGLGIGLFFVKDVIEEKFQGKVHFKRDQGFSEFILTFPYIH